MTQTVTQDNQPMGDAPENGTPEKTGKKQQKKKSWQRELLSWILTFAVAIVLALGIRTFLFQFVRVEGRSMIETLQNEEIMFTTRLEYWTGDPQRFDVVICHYPNRTENFVKRIVGLPGDTLEIKGGYLYVNGEMYEEPYITHRPDYSMSAYTVPEGQYFVLGDNRSNSNDSHLIGPIDRSMIVGHVRSVVFPFSAWRAIE